MADTVEITPGSGAVIGTDEVTIGGTSQQVQRVKLVDGTDGGTDLIPGDATGLAVHGSRGSLTDGSGTIASGGTSEEVFAANASRRYLLIQNISDTDMYVNFGGAATAGAGSFLLPKNGGSLVQDAGFVSTQSVEIRCATSGKAYTAKEA